MRYAYDANNRFISITDPVGLVTTLTYSGNQVSSVSDPTGRETLFQHDANANLVRVTYPDGSEQFFGYDSRHLMISESSRRGFVTMREYDRY
jgi:YD repeat-containing protein